jgi:hypothetical protein
MKPDLQESVERVREEQAALQLECQRRLEQDDLLDEDGYPTESALWLLEHWSFEDPLGWLDLAKRLWHFQDLTWSEESVVDDFREGHQATQLHVSAFGWSGNESLISAMQANWMLWSLCWVQSRRGGHYIFEIPEMGDVDEDPTPDEPSHPGQPASDLPALGASRS